MLVATVQPLVVDVERLEARLAGDIRRELEPLEIRHAEDLLRMLAAKGL